ncbi:MAG: glutamate-1-semialdehyde 2,1-aminomutase [Simkania sp.]|nr:glutamate-1-semialdehyde 2,1-aminomutase [Simkania sp.]
MSLRRPRSEVNFLEASTLIPGGVNSPVRAFKGLGVDPLVVEKGEGAIIEDVDGNCYIDYCNSWGALIHGHNAENIVEAAQTQLAKGSSFGITTAVETEIARRIIGHIPSIDMLRFVSSGTEATMSAIRLARAATGKSTIVKFEGHYHGHSDCLLIKAGSGVAQLPESSSLGVPPAFVQYTRCLPFNDFDACRKLLQENHDIAAVLLEPVTANMGVVVPKPGFLEMLREETSKRGILLIFDEVVTGFRLGLHGAQGLFNIDPDLTCLGKIIGGGFPAAAYGGKKQWMELVAPLGGVYQAGTLSGFPVAMAAGNAALAALERPGFYEELQEKTERLAQPIQQYIHEQALPVALQKIGSMFTLYFGVNKVETYGDLKGLDVQAFRLFFAFMLEQGIYIPPSQVEAWFISSAHSEKEIDRTAKAVVGFLREYYQTTDSIHETMNLSKD